ncbi:hypothetical protein [Lactobacillus crispatus]|uniref:hypothetical protein n=1 Tax=Lactobacillus crispatus TaxID=47770 RepID=UPI0014151563|nr:hypothetical protein [Lactobacillus crispatus]
MATDINRKEDYMEITIDVDTYEELKDYADRLNEPMSMIATKAIKRYIDSY